jgi:7-cyano-7-deazaguanine synthase in queuosine biosynthesis
MVQSSLHIVLCNGASLPGELSGQSEIAPLHLGYRHIGRRDPNVRIELPDFVSQVYHLPDRVLDLLELAAYAYCADRFVSRGDLDQVVYQGWSRNMHFVIKVRDCEFWTNSGAADLLNEALTFLSGDREWKFTFQGGHSTPRTSLFDEEQFRIDSPKDTRVMLFSGGLDSLAGVIDQLEKTTNRLCLVSHRSGQPDTVRTQDQLFRALHQQFPMRLQHYKFHCSLTNVRAHEETQRTRGFLYAATAYSICEALSQRTFYIHENGITSLNFPRRQHLMNARATRTTHPKTITLLEKLFSLLSEKTIDIQTPFFWMTKGDVLKLLGDSQNKNLITSAVSCSKTFLDIGQATHCGGCSQCVDRRFAAYSSALDELDQSGIYALDAVQDTVTDGEVKTTLVDYIRQGCNFAGWNLDHFNDQMLNELAQVVDHVGADTQEEAVEKIWKLCRRHGEQVIMALKRMRAAHDDLRKKPRKGSILEMISGGEHLKQPLERLVNDICARLTRGLPIVFQRHLPRDENDLNDKMDGLLNAERPTLEREHPAFSFGLARVIPDHSWAEHDLLIESKYLRKATTPSKVSDGISSDLMKYPDECFILYVVFDPTRSIHDDETFSRAFESKRPCRICVIR